MQYPLTVAGVGLHDGKFTNGDPLNGIAPSLDRAEDMNRIYDELINLTVGAGLVPSESDNGQVLKAIRKLTIPTVFNSILKPTAAPTPENPSNLLINNNNEIFMWVGIAWVLLGNGHAASVSQSADITLSDSVYTTLLSMTVPRVGTILVTSSQYAVQQSGTNSWGGFYLYKNGISVSRMGLISMIGAAFGAFEESGSSLIDVAAGDVISIVATRSSPGSVVVSKAAQDNLKYAYLT